VARGPATSTSGVYSWSFARVAENVGGVTQLEAIGEGGRPVCAPEERWGTEVSRERGNQRGQ